MKVNAHFFAANKKARCGDRHLSDGTSEYAQSRPAHDPGGRTGDADSNDLACQKPLSPSVCALY